MNKSVIYLKKIDYLLGPILLKASIIFKKTKHSPARLSIDANHVKRILVIRPGGLGDAALLFPSLKILRSLFPLSSVDVLCEKRNNGIFFRSPFVSRILDYRRLKDIKILLQNSYDLIIDTEQSHLLTTVLVSFFRRSLKVGFRTNGRESVYDIAVSYSHEEYEANSFFRLFSFALKNWPEHFEWDFPYIVPSSSERNKVKALLDSSKNVVCMFPGASIKERRWPASRWAKLAGLLHTHGYQPVLIGANGEKSICNEIVKQSNNKIQNLCGLLSLRETAALFEESQLLISTDSGILHVGVVCNIPTVSLFGPGIAMKWAPRGKKHIVINKRMNCSPCTRFGETPPCPINARCIKDIKVEEVMESALNLLNENCEL